MSGKWNKIETYGTPKANKHCLVWCPDNLCMFTAYISYGMWYCANDFEELTERVTHWRKLPKTPKFKENVDDN